MKSKLLYFVLSLLAVTAFWSCDDDSTAGMTRITYYPELTLEGATTVFVDKGSAFVEPGYTALLNGEDVTDQVQVSSNVNTSKSGVYSVSYSIVNEDGFASNASREVIVLDANDPVEGAYYVDPTSYRFYNGAALAYGSSFMILVINRGDGTYSVDDLLGGWYCQRAGYGTDYAMQGVVVFEADGTITMLDSYVPGWGDSATSLTESSWDAATGTISYNLEYTDYPFNFYVTMYKN